MIGSGTALSELARERVSSPPGRVDDRLARMLEEYYRLVWRTLRRLGIPECNVEDETQKVFIIASEKLDHIAGEKERAFLLGTATLVAANARRSLARRSKLTDDVDAQGEVHRGECLDPEQIVDWKRRRELLDELLDRLPFDQRMVFVLFELEGMSTPEIAHQLGVPVGTVASRLRRGRQLFQREIASVRERFGDR